MQDIHDLVSEVTQKYINPKAITDPDLKWTLERISANVTPQQSQKTEPTKSQKHLQQLRLTEEQIAETLSNCESDLVSFIREKPDKFNSSSGHEEDRNTESSELIENVSRKAANEILKTLSRRIPRLISEANKEDKRFYNKEISPLWGDPLNRLNILIRISESANIQRVDITKKESQNAVFVVLARLSAKSIRVAKEINVLLKSGFAEGAYARWRTLHEAEVIANIIFSCGEVLASRYLAHASVRVFESLKKIKNREGVEEADNIESFKYQELKKEYDDVIARYGFNFRYEYGWASEELGMKKPTFVDIENAANMTSQRASYGFASGMIHCGSFGMFADIMQEAGSSDLLSGPSQLGLAIPGRDTARSLGMISLRFLAHRPTIESLVWMRLISRYIQLSINAFTEIEHKIDDALAAG